LSQKTNKNEVDPVVGFFDWKLQLTKPDSARFLAKFNGAQFWTEKFELKQF
jgi:hypothetical protein